ncbi:hypothetical protein LRS10_07180 [Phenylobacterium sp. J426]|uniref:MBOAT family O-acyltransferase n=1 Tax=Phenylobacterium sp. J426 TaxID=2898439 RepID=UPI0021515AB9|nr:MBOAT family O-acyltransferase [Phenylobacterium sp. J426]MCR5873971.1 hypothetical protein [Phenylobacterium sp. J426]
MVFSSVIFIFYFLPLFLLGYYLSGWRTGALLAGSAVFYTWGEGPYVFLLLALIGLNYAGARSLDGLADPTRRRLALGALIAIDLSVLGWFKYAGFFAANLNALLPGDPLPAIDPRLPLGISFFTFQLISYLFRRAPPPGDRGARPHPLRGLHPDVPAPDRGADRPLRPYPRRAARRPPPDGPDRPGHPVLHRRPVPEGADRQFGGAFGRPRLRTRPPGSLDVGTAWLGMLAYTLQIYFDFCGYSNMAIGLAFMLGFTFPKNFDYPYMARSVTEFWRRWHISLSSWFRDYVYIPLGGNRGGAWKTVRNLLVVFLLTGFWHGAAWNFVVWGLFHGGFLLIERFGLGRVLERLPRAMATAYTLLAVMAGWVLFRDESLTEALRYWGALVDPAGVRALPVATQVVLDNQVLAALALGCVFAYPVLPWAMSRLNAPRLPPSPTLEARLDTQAVHVLATPVLIAGLVLSVAYLAGSSLNPFLYFRF